ncbi:MAG: FAD-binding oxidoreductase [Deltaproteobacteria bacterium]|nr:FAD-binding oxidoreductase [Deltaproteobacteria bacterium]
MAEYDVVIVGASFAGLSVAFQLDGRVLLIDPYDIGVKTLFFKFPADLRYMSIIKG